MSTHNIGFLRRNKQNDPLIIINYYQIQKHTLSVVDRNSNGAKGDKEMEGSSVRKGDQDGRGDFLALSHSGSTISEMLDWGKI